MKVTARFALLCCALLMVGCGPKRIDGSSEASYKASLEAMSKGLMPEQQKALAESVMTVAMDGANILQIGSAPGLFEQKARAALNGKTFAEIVSLAKEIDAKAAAAEAVERAEEEKRAAAAKAARKKEIEGEVAELTEKKTKAESDANILKKFEVQRSRFYFQETSYRKQAVIEVTVKNGLPEAVSRAYFKATLTSPGRTIPWVDAGFNYSIPGGLEPGESATWKLSPNMFTEWGQAPADRTDLVLTLQTVMVDGAGEKALYAAEFSESSLERLKKLQDSLQLGNF